MSDTVHPQTPMTLEKRAEQMWRVHPKDLDRLGYVTDHLGRIWDPIEKPGPRERFYLDHLKASVDQVKLYRWHSQALKNYRTGDILALGTDVEDARRRARLGFMAVATEHYQWMIDKYPDYQARPDDIEDRDAKLALLEADIMKEPAVAESFFLSGGE